MTSLEIYWNGNKQFRLQCVCVLFSHAISRGYDETLHKNAAVIVEKSKIVPITQIGVCHYTKIFIQINPRFVSLKVKIWLRLKLIRRTTDTASYRPSRDQFSCWRRNRPVVSTYGMMGGGESFLI